MFSTLKIGVVVLTCPPILPKSRGWGGGGVSRYAIYYYTPLPFNSANKQQASKHVAIPFWPLPLPNTSGLTLL